VPPNYSADGDAPVVDLPELLLVWNNSNQRYEVEYGGFTEGGPGQPYTVFIYARDIWGQVSMPAVTTVTQEGFLNRFVVMAHGHASDNKTSRRVRELADFAHEAALVRRVTPENIRYLSDETARNTRVTHAATSAVFQDALVNWPLPADKSLESLTIYLVGDASRTGLLCSNGDVITPAQLKAWLDQLQAATGCSVNLIVDSDYSGQFVAGCASLLYPRVVISGSLPGQKAPGSTLWTGLSRWFWQAVAKGQDVRSSFSYASDVMRWLGAVPFMLDDDGDGSHNRSRDGLNSRSSFVGAAFVTASDPPHIGLASKPLQANIGDTVNIWAAEVVMPDGNPPSQVWAEVMGPDGNLLQSVELLWNSVYSRYDGFVDGFVSSGRHVALIYAGNPADPRSVSPAAPIQIFVGGSPALVVDGSSAGLKLPMSGQILEGAIEASGAPFEVIMPAAPGQKVSVEVFGVSLGRNVSLSILAPDGTALASRDDWGNGFGEKIWAWEPTSAANYRVRVSAAPAAGRTSFSLRGFHQQETIDLGNRDDQSISLNLPDQWGMDQGALSISGSATSGLPLELEILEGAGSMEGSSFLPSSEGLVTLRARQNGSGTFAPAAPITKTVNIVTRGETFDQWMKRHFGTSVSVDALRHTDSDKDGRSNLQEYQAATDPRDSKSLFQASAPVRNGAAFEVRWEAKRGIKYRVLSSTNLSTWQEEPSSRRTGIGSVETHRDTDITNRVRKFYKIETVE
jgi:hypothetical protein